jgi:hypothetical protein
VVGGASTSAVAEAYRQQWGIVRVAFVCRGVIERRINGALVSPMVAAHWQGGIVEVANVH